MNLEPLLSKVCLCAGLVLGHAHAAQYALLVGVSGYPNLTQLPGAANDVKLMRSVLERKGFKPEHIQTLADSAPGSALPTRANILKALERLIAKTGEGDYVYLHFSGHGAQQYAPEDAREAEPDGLSEIFLPIDVGRATGGRKQVPNAIADYELNNYLNRFLAKGTFVWGVFDACHSATLLRGSDDFTYRFVPPKELGLDLSSVAPAKADGNMISRGGPPEEMPLNRSPGKVTDKGGFVAFYGAQTNQLAPEGLMPRGLLPDDPRRAQHGVLTYTLAEAMENFNGGSFRQLSQYIQQRYLAQSVIQANPAFSGDSLDANVFTPHVESGIRQWPLSRVDNKLSIPAGALQQIGPGSQFAVLPNAVADDGQFLARVQAVQVSPLSTELRLMLGKDGVQINTDSLPSGAVARLTNPAVSMTLLVALAQEKGKVDRRLQEMVSTLKSQVAAGLRVEWVKPGQIHDLQLHLKSGRVWLRQAGLPLVTQGSEPTPSIAVDKSRPATLERLGNALVRAAKAINVHRLAGTLAGTGSDASGYKLAINLRPTGSDKHVPLTAASVVTAGTEVCFEASNAGHAPLDLTFLLVDSSFGITSLFPKEGEVNRLFPGEKLTTVCINVEAPFGLDRLIAFAVPARLDRPSTDLSFLAQAALARTRASEDAGDLEALLTEAAFGTEPGITRGAARPRVGQLSRAVVRLEQWVSRSGESVRNNIPVKAISHQGAGQP